MKKYRVIRSAKTDMLEIKNYIAEDSEKAARALITRFRSAFEMLR